MEGLFYTNEENVQIVISLLKQNNIRKVIVSPGATNITFVGSIQHDDFFDIYSCVDERSAAYLAVGMAAETGEIVAINCTGATSSRNWMPALTEAFYRKLPILAISSSQLPSKEGQLVAQVTNRHTPPPDTVVKSFQIDMIKDNDDRNDAIVKANSAISYLRKNGGGPVHINLITNYSRDYSVAQLPVARKISVIDEELNIPELPKNGRIAISIGSHFKFDEETSDLIEKFCEENNAVVICDHTSGYYGKYRVNLSIILEQKYISTSLHKIGLLIHIGEVSGDYYSLYKLWPQEVWRVNEDGEIRDFYHKLSHVFQMSPKKFLKNVVKNDKSKSLSYFDECFKECSEMMSKVPELPFSNLWIASQLSKLIPNNSSVHFGILNTLRSWNYFSLPDTVETNSNVGGFGIDGILSTVVGASISNPQRLFFCIIGDLSFFYDMNVVGNRHIGNNLRIMLINNGRGQEFRNYSHPGNKFGKESDLYMAAAWHYGNKSQMLVKGMAESLGYKYLCANDKTSYLKAQEKFVAANCNTPIIFEVFTDTKDESDALDTIVNINKAPDGDVPSTQKIKNKILSLIGGKSV